MCHARRRRLYFSLSICGSVVRLSWALSEVVGWICHLVLDTFTTLSSLNFGGNERRHNWKSIFWFLAYLIGEKKTERMDDKATGWLDQNFHINTTPSSFDFILVFDGDTIWKKSTKSENKQFIDENGLMLNRDGDPVHHNRHFGPVELHRSSSSLRICVELSRLCCWMLAGSPRSRMVIMAADTLSRCRFGNYRPIFWNNSDNFVDIIIGSGRWGCLH